MSFLWRKLIPRAFRSSNKRRVYQRAAAARERWDERVLLEVEALETRVVPAGTPNIWAGAAAANWSTGSNWSLGHAPTATEIATFNNTDTNSPTIDASAVLNLSGIAIQTGYTGTLDDTANNIAVTLGTDGFAQAGGTFKTASSGKFQVAGDFTISGGTFTDNNIVTFTGVVRRM